VRVACVGGGPGGLFLSILLARAGRHTVDVFERHAANVTYGFGVVFSRMSAARLRAGAMHVLDEVLDHGVKWESIEVRVRGTSFKSSGHGFGAVDRQTLIRVLQKHAQAAGARIHHSTPAHAANLLEDYDVIVAADGAGSGTRRHLADHFRPTVTHGSSRYIWLAMDRAVESMQFLIADGRDGPVGAHVYPYSAVASTFLAEVPEDVWRRAGFTDEQRPPGWNDDLAKEYCEEVFAQDLAGARLIGNGSRWQTFTEVRNERWFAPPVVLLGDAAHTAHFSVGSGTSMAMEDAAELARCLARFDRVDAAFEAYQAARQPSVAAIQESAWTSSQFWERLQNEVGRDVGELMLRLLTRTGQTDLDTLLRIDGHLSTVLRPASDIDHAHDAIPAVRWGDVHREPHATGAALVESSQIAEINAFGEDLSRWDCVAVTADWQEDYSHEPQRCAHDIGELRKRASRTPCGLFVLVDTKESQRLIVDRLRAHLCALRNRVALDFVSVGRISLLPAARALQMVLCDFVKSELRLPAVYACTPEHLNHARTHVQAARADQIWLLQGSW
jgi:2-polyprenyl-6-methoxyphenol hydroxylase-like FAD-dependent oxidoreductase